MAGRPKYGIIEIYHELVKKRNGELPTTREIADLSGAVIGYVRKALEREGLPYHKFIGNTAATAAHRRKRDEKDKIFREKHAELTHTAGRYPTRIEMNIAVGYERNSSSSGDVARRLGLELTPIRQKPEKAEVTVRQEKPAIPPVDAAHDFGHRAAPNMTRILEIRNGDTYGEGKGWGHIAGEEHAPTDRVMITCPVCGARRIISPRMHPFWLRNRLGKVVFVDSRACTGQGV